jgi:hypothetical protein
MQLRDMPAHSRLTLPQSVRALAPVERITPKTSAQVSPVLSANRSFRVLKSSSTPTQLSLFPPPGRLVNGAR